MARHTEVDIEQLLQSPIKWQQNGDDFHVQMDAATVSSLPAGAYEPNIGISGPYLSKIDLKQEELIPFKSGPCKEIIEEVNRFWNLKDRYDRLGLPYRRGILMYGPPGTGKSGIIRLACQRLIDSSGMVMIVKNADTFSEFLPLLNKLEPSRNLIVVLEDLERLMSRQEQEFLQLLDGISNDRPGMLFLATTNHLEHLEERVYRPSRFDLLIEVGMPNKKTRETYVRRMCQKFNARFNPKMVTMTNGLSFAALKEILISHFVLDKDITKMIARMRGYVRLAEDMYEEDDE